MGASRVSASLHKQLCVFFSASSMSNTLALFEAKDQSAVDLRLLSAFYGWANFGTVARSNLVEKILIQLVDVMI